MPRCVFKLLWDAVIEGQEIFAYVVNRCKNGDHYWVFAHVTACYDSEKGTLIGYHSNRRASRREAIDIIEPLYRQLSDVERQGRKEGLEASMQVVANLLEKKNMTYGEFILSF
jgi:hypothetical protein